MADHRPEDRRRIAHEFLTGKIEVHEVSENDEKTWKAAAAAAGLDLHYWITISLRCAALYTLALTAAMPKGGPK